MKNFFITLLLIAPILANSQSLAIINDPDGYTNMRKGPGSQYEIIGRIKENELFHLGELDSAWYHMYKIEDTYVEGYLHKSRVVPFDQLQKIGKPEFKSGRLFIDASNIQFSIKRNDFIKSEHQYELDGETFVTKIDGKHPYGVDGGYPSTMMAEMKLTIDQTSVDIPTSAYSDLYNINYNYIEIRKDDNETLYIRMANNSDGAGYYEAVWIFRDRKYLRRFVIQA